MLRRFREFAGVTLLVASSGCAMCSSEFDCDYAAFGGAWDRHDRSAGRVGSAFDPAGERVIAGKPAAATQLDERDEPEPPEFPDSPEGDSMDDGDRTN